MSGMVLKVTSLQMINLISHTTKHLKKGLQGLT